MIGEYSLELLCKKYNLSTDKILNNNRNILTYGEYIDIDKTLDYLINTLKIVARNIEKCPSVLYRNVGDIKLNVEYLKSKNISFSNVETCLHVLSNPYSSLKETYEYVVQNYGINALNKTTSILSCPVDVIKSVESLNINIPKNGYLSIAVSIEYGMTSLEEVKRILQSAEYKAHPELFTSRVLAYAKIEDIQKLLQSAEYKAHPELFTSETLVHAKLEDIQMLLHSAEYKAHPELFTSQVLAYAKIEDIQMLLHSAEYKAHPELFTSTTLARAKIEDIQMLLHSAEYKAHPELFTSQVLAHARLEDIQMLLQSAEYKAHPELFTSTTLAHAKLEDIQMLLNMACWKDERYKRLLQPTIISNSKMIVKKLPILLKLAEEYGISDNINVNFLLKSPSQDYALIRYLEENNIPLVKNGKLNPIFTYQPGVLKRKYGFDLNELIKKYPFQEKGKIDGRF